MYSRHSLSLLAAAVALAAAWTHGAWTLSQPLPDGPGATVRLVQPNAEQALKWDPELARRFLDRLLDATAAAPDGTAPPDLVIWPETALPYLFEYHPELAPMIAEAAQGATVALGVQRAEEGRYWNSLAVIEPDGTVSQTYDKHHLVPFGEYMPLGDLAHEWFGLSAFAAQHGAGYTAGTGPKLLDFGPVMGRALPLICYEAVFPQDLRGTGRPDWLLQITNDAWFGTLSGPFQHADQARLRAILSLRIDLEGNAVRLAMQSGRDGLLDRLTRANAIMDVEAARPNPSIKAYLAANHAFHFCLYEASAAPVLVPSTWPCSVTRWSTSAALMPNQVSGRRCTWLPGRGRTRSHATSRAARAASSSRGGASPTPASGFKPTWFEGTQMSSCPGSGRRSVPGRVKPREVSLPGSGSSVR